MRMHILKLFEKFPFADMIYNRATILLHEPHAHIRSTGCVSALKILTAARATLDLIYVVWSTSFDITLLDLFCTVSAVDISGLQGVFTYSFFQYCWFMAGRILVRFLQAAMDANSQEQITPLRAELDFVRCASLRLLNGISPLLIIWLDWL
jgi:hypothetical protein